MLVMDNKFWGHEDTIEKKYSFPLSGYVSTCVPTIDCRQNRSSVSSILPNGIDTDGRSIAGVDWSDHKVFIKEKDKVVQTFETLAEAAKHYTGYIWALESSADSFELTKRKVDLDAIEAADIWAYCFNSRFTARHRKLWNIPDKTDEIDAEVILRIFTETNITCGKIKQLNNNDILREPINKAMMEDRRSKSEISIAVARKYLPTFDNTPGYLHEFLYEAQSIKSKRPKNPTTKKQIGRLLMTAEKVRDKGRGYREFRRQVGNYGQGYGCMMRSDYFHHWLRSITKARLKKEGIEPFFRDGNEDEEEKIRVWTEPELKIKKEVMRELEKITKWLWKLTKKQ